MRNHNKFTKMKWNKDNIAKKRIKLKITTNKTLKLK